MAERRAPWTLALWLALASTGIGVLGCPRGHIPAQPPDEPFAQPPPGDPAHAEPAPDHRAVRPSEPPAAGCPLAIPRGECPRLGEQCRYGDTFCRCSSPCSGAEPEYPEPNTWACLTRDSACPERVPEAGTRCRPAGLHCGYGTCGGASAKCERGGWQVFEQAPPA